MDYAICMIMLSTEILTICLIEPMNLMLIKCPNTKTSQGLTMISLTQHNTSSQGMQDTD